MPYQSELSVKKVDAIHLETQTLKTIKPGKGEAGMAQSDWLQITIPKLKEKDAVLSYVTSGDIDAIHIIS